MRGINLVIVQVVIKYLFCYYQFNSSGTLFVLLDIDKDILDWLSQLDSKELSNCSWLLVVPANATSMPLTSINDNINSTQKSVISKLFSPFKSMTSKLPFKREWVGIREFQNNQKILPSFSFQIFVSIQNCMYWLLKLSHHQVRQKAIDVRRVIEFVHWPKSTIFPLVDFLKSIVPHTSSKIIVVTIFILFFTFLVMYI